MDINQRSKEFARYIKNTNEFKLMNKARFEIEKNKSLKKQLDNYINTKNNIYSRYKLEEASKKISQLNIDHTNFFNVPIVSNYMSATRNFNSMMDKIYKTIENELLK